MANTQIEAMRLALEALHFARLSIDEWSGYASDYFQNKYDLKGDIAEVEQAITALRTAIEQAAVPSAERGEAHKKQKPSTRACRSCGGSGERDTGIAESPTAICKPCAGTGQITTPPAAPVQEPVQRWAVFCGGCRKEWSVPYQHPGKSICADCEAKLREKNAAQPAVPLTDEQIIQAKAAIKGTLDVQFVQFARAIEAAHGITGEKK